MGSEEISSRTNRAYLCNRFYIHLHTIHNPQLLQLPILSYRIQNPKSTIMSNPSITSQFLLLLLSQFSLQWQKFPNTHPTYIIWHTFLIKLYRTTVARCPLQSSFDQFYKEIQRPEHRIHVRCQKRQLLFTTILTSYLRS